MALELVEGLPAGARPAVWRWAATLWLLLGGPVRRLRPRRVPVVLQMTSVDCGAACLAMVLSYHGRKTTLAEARDALAIGRDGVTAQRLVTEARRQGLRVQAVALDPSQFGVVPLPAIVYWTFNHFVIVERWSLDQIDVVDPAQGRRRLSADEFATAFSGVVLALEPGARFEPRDGHSPSAWRTYLGSLWRLPGARRALGQILAASACLELLGLAVPLAVQVLVDHVLPTAQTALLPLLAAGLAAGMAAYAATSYIRGLVLVNLRTRLDAHVLLDLFARTVGLPLRFFQQRSTGDLVMRLESTMDLREILTGQAVSVGLDTVLLVGYLAVLTWQAPSLALVVLAIGAFQACVALASAAPIQRLMQRDLAARGATQGYLAEALHGIATLKASGVEERAQRDWQDLLSGQLAVAAQRGRAAAAVDAAMSTLRVFGPLAVLWMGTVEVLSGELSLGAMLGLQALGTALLVPVGSLVQTGQQVQLAIAYLERIADILEAEPEALAPVEAPMHRLSGRIELRDVSFRYTVDGPPVLRDVSLTIEAGQSVALVGRTGSGKSTLATLLLGLDRPTEGEIRFDDVPLSDWNLRSLRRQCGVVLQEPTLFSGSIRDNIAFHDPQIPQAAIVAAARRAIIHDDIAGMPMQYETRLAEGGAGMSGGQRQRIALARALVREPSILVLDEATSALDTMTERQVERNLHVLACTRVVIAHRLSTIRNADLIVVVEGGTIVERGSHDELLTRGGLYAQLVSEQQLTAAAA